MKHLKNEQGAALVLTIMIITLILLFALTLSYQVLNTTKQVDTMEKNIDARSMAEMGATYYQTYVDEKAKKDNFDQVCEFDPPKPDDLKEKPSIDEDRSFKIKSIEETYLECECEDDDDNEDEECECEEDKCEKGNNDDDDDDEINKLLINFESVGTSHGKSATVQGTIKIKSAEIDESDD